MGSLVILLHFTFQALQAGKLGDNLVKIADEQAQAVVNKNHIDLIDRSLNEKGIWFSCYVQINFYNLTFPGKECPSQGYENTLHVREISFDPNNSVGSAKKKTNVFNRYNAHHL